MSGRLRIGIDARVLAELAPMGVARYLTGLLQAVAEAAPHYDYLLYLCGSPLADRLFTTKPFLQRVLTSHAVLSSPWIWQQGYLPWRVWRDGVDVLLAPYYCGPLFSPVPQIVCLYDISFTLFPQDFPSWIHFKPKLLARPTSRAAARVVTVSEFSRQEIIRTYGLAPDKVVVIPPGSVSGRRQCLPTAGGTPLVPGETPFFLFVGSFLPRRQVDLVIRALAQLPSDYRLVMVGESNPAKQAPLRRIAQQCGVADRVQCLGHVSDPALDDLYRRAIALVLPSTYEGFGLPVLEAMTRGLPVVAWDIPVMREVAGDAAVLVQSGDVAGLTQALLQLGTDQGGRQALSEAGKQRATQFSWQRSAGILLAVLREVTETPPACTPENRGFQG
jgi:glycosyltransferase involved in cell wall biosynthesis